MAEKSGERDFRDIRAIFQKGNDALLRENYDYAVDLLTRSWSGSRHFTKAARRSASGAAEKAGGGGGFFKKAWSSASSSPLVAQTGKIALAQKIRLEALAIGEQILK